MTVHYEVPIEFTVLEVDKFKDEIYGEIASGPIQLEIDFSKCTFIDSTGLGAIVSVFKRLNQNNGTLVIKHLQPQVEELFHLTRLDQVMDIKK